MFPAVINGEMENDPKWHGAHIDAESYAEGRPELTGKLSEYRENLKKGQSHE